MTQSPANPGETETGRPRRRRDLPIVVALMAGFGLLVAVAVALVFTSGYQVARLNTTELTRDKSELLIDSILRRIQGHLDPARAQLEYLAGLIGARGLDLERRDDLGRLLLSSLAAAPQVSVVAYVGPDLRVLRAFRNRPERPLQLSDWSDDPAIVAAVRAAEAAAGPVWGDLFVADEIGLTYINLLLPLPDTPQGAATLIAGISILELSEFLDNLGHRTSDNAFILYGRDQVLAHRRLLEGLPRLSDAHPLPTLEELGDPVLATIWTPDSTARLEARFANDVEARVAEVQGEQYVFLFRELTGYGKRPWLVGTYLPTRELAPQYERLTSVLAVGGAVLVAALALAMLLGRGIGRPIRQLAAGARRVRRLDLESAPALGRGPFREVNEAAAAYNGMVDGLREFERYVPSALVRRLLRREAAERLESEEREVTVLFTDIAGFTALAERLPAAQVARLLNAHFTLVDRCIEAEGGTLDKYIGDAVMAFWGAPDEQPDHAARACRAALAMAHALRVDNEARMAAGHDRLRVRVGIHSGPVVVGNIGAPSRINYTVIGDTVNTAERLEALARDSAPAAADVHVVVSGETAAQAGQAFAFKRMGSCRLAGRHEPVATFELCGLEAQEPGSRRPRKVSDRL